MREGEDHRRIDALVTGWEVQIDQRSDDGGADSIVTALFDLRKTAALFDFPVAHRPSRPTAGELASALFEAEAEVEAANGGAVSI